MLIWVHVPEYLAACLENKNEGFGVKGQRIDKFWFMVTGRKDAAHIRLFRNSGQSGQQKDSPWEWEERRIRGEEYIKAIS